MPTPKVFQLLHFPDTPSLISGRLSINLSLLFSKSTVFPSQRVLHLPAKSISAGPKHCRLLPEAIGDRRVCAMEAVMGTENHACLQLPPWQSGGSKEQLSEENRNQIDLSNKKVNEEYPGTTVSSLEPESCPSPVCKHFCQSTSAKGESGHMGCWGKNLQRRRKWFNHSYKGDSQSETSGVQRQQIITNLGSGLESREPSAAVFCLLL